MSTAIVPGVGYVVLDTTPTPADIAEGVVNDVIHAINTSRRANHIPVTALVHTTLGATPDTWDHITPHLPRVREATRSYDVTPNPVQGRVAVVEAEPLSAFEAKWWPRAVGLAADRLAAEATE